MSLVARIFEEVGPYLNLDISKVNSGGERFSHSTLFIDVKIASLGTGPAEKLSFETYTVKSYLVLTLPPMVMNASEGISRTGEPFHPSQ